MSERYSRQEIVLGSEGQRKVTESSVAVVGVGALGTVVAEQLVRAGVGKIFLVDRDVVEESNLQRQTLFVEKDVGRSKVDAAVEKLQEINSSVTIVGKAVHLSVKNVDCLDVDLIVDCTDNLETRFLLDDYCRKNGKHWVYGAAIKKEGYVMLISPEGPWLRNFVQEASLETCESAGVLGMTTSAVGSLQAALALQFLAGENVVRELCYINIGTMTMRKMAVVKKELDDFKYLEKKEDIRKVRFCGGNKFQIFGRAVDFAVLKERYPGAIEDSETLRVKGITLFKDGRALVVAASEEEARSVYSKVVGN